MEKMIEKRIEEVENCKKKKYIYIYMDMGLKLKKVHRALQFKVCLVKIIHRSQYTETKSRQKFMSERLLQTYK